MRINRYNGDGPLRIDQRAAYLLYNAIDNRFPYRGLDPAIALADFRNDRARDRLSELSGTPSPSRAMSDLFWMHLPWAEMERELGPLRIFDLGCGSGAYAVKFAKWSGSRVARYVGLDLQPHPHWTELAASHPSVEFRAGDVERLDEVIPADTNLIVSQSTIEHVRNDIVCFDRIRRWVRRVERPVIQIHLVPSAACLRLFLWHGYRQYTPRTLASIACQFTNSDRVIVRLGGAACNQLHWKFVTWPLLIRRTGDLREARPVEYRRALETAIARDMTRPQPSPAFYALLIHSNPDMRLLDYVKRAIEPSPITPMPNA